MDDTQAKPRVQSVARAVDVLLLIASQGSNGIAAKDIADTLDLPRQVIYHLIHTLVEVGMLQRAEGTRYVLGLAVANVAEGFKRQMQTHEKLGDYSKEVAEQTGETAYVCGWVNGEVVVRATSRGSMAIHAAEVPLGTTGNAHCRASGKLLLSMLSDDECDAYVKLHPMKRVTRNTITTLSRLHVELNQIRKTRIATEFEEYNEGVACVALPLGVEPTKLILGLSAPVERFSANIEEYIAKLKLIAGRYRALQ